MNAILSDFYLGLDSFVLCLGVGSLERSYRTWFLLALSFGTADALGTALGTRWGQIDPGLPPVLGFAGPVVMVAYGCFVIVATARLRTIAASRTGLMLLPLLMSLDNLTAAALDRGSEAASTWSTFVATGIMALLGCAFGAAVTRRWPALKRPLPGGAAVAAALVMSLA